MSSCNGKIFKVFVVFPLFFSFQADVMKLIRHFQAIVLDFFGEAKYLAVFSFIDIELVEKVKAQEDEEDGKTSIHQSDFSKILFLLKESIYE